MHGNVALVILLTHHTGQGVRVWNIIFLAHVIIFTAQLYKDENLRLVVLPFRLSP